MKNNLLRFNWSVRSIFAIVTVLAVILGINNRNTAAIRHELSIASLGNSVAGIDIQVYSSGIDITDVKELPISLGLRAALWPPKTYVSLQGIAIADRQVQLLTSLAYTYELQINQCSIESVPQLNSLLTKKVKQLELSENKFISPRDSSLIIPSEVTLLTICQSGLLPFEFSLSQCRKSLRQLTLRGVWATDHLPDLVQLERLSCLDIAESHLADRVLQDIQLPKRITVLNLSRNDIGCQSVNRLLAQLPKLKQLALNSTLVDDSLSIDLTEIESLSVAKTRVTDSFLERLCRAPKLFCLDISHTSITSKCISDLKKMTSLQRDYLNVRGTSIEKEMRRTMESWQ